MSVYVCVRDVSACVHVFARARARVSVWRREGLLGTGTSGKRGTEE